ncbi:hypothetical protein ASE39_15320 [Acidovorax sp. Root267]|nr:hypothetical protein ASE39_15320 [Acidovorax sp. Root267]
MSAGSGFERNQTQRTVVNANDRPEPIRCHIVFLGKPGSNFLNILFIARDVHGIRGWLFAKRGRNEGVELIHSQVVTSDEDAQHLTELADGTFDFV